MTSSFREVKIPEDLYLAAKNRFANQFSSVDDLVTFALRELLREDSVSLDQSEQEMIQSRLKDLGYL